MELSNEQLEIINSPEMKILVSAAAGSGKTAVLTERIRKLVSNGVDPHSICAITFTNLAANEMKKRLNEDKFDGLTISTIHGLAAKFLTSYGINIGPIVNSQKFDDFFTLIEKYPRCVQHINYILIDEFQDVSNEEYRFVFDMIDPDGFFAIGDAAQCIYEGIGANPRLFTSLENNPDVTVYNLHTNYRCKSNILSYAKQIILTDKSIACNQGGKVIEGYYSMEDLASIIEDEPDYENWAILCYTNAEVENILTLLNSHNIPTVTFKQGGLSKKELDEIMYSNKVKVLTCWAAKGLEFPKVIVYGRNWVHGAQRKRVDYVAATRAIDQLIWCKQPKKVKRSYW